MSAPSRATRLASRRRTRWVLIALGLLALLAAWDGWQWARLASINREVERIVATPLTQSTAGAADGSVGGAASAAADANGGAPPEIRFAQAWALAEAGRLDAALNRYRVLQADTPLGQAARFNAANLLLRQATELRAGEQPGQSIALIELAKETLRELLRIDPQHWDARYNLERAQRLLPDPEPGEDMSGAAPEQRERAATTMRGYSPGLP